MPFRQWLLLVVLLSLSVLVSVLPLVYVLVVDPDLYYRMFRAARPPRGVPFIQLLEPFLAYGLTRRRFWALTIGLWYFASKGVYAAGLSVGMALNGQKQALWVGLPLALLWLGIALFLYLKRDDFDQ